MFLQLVSLPILWPYFFHKHYNANNNAYTCDFCLSYNKQQK